MKPACLPDAAGAAGGAAVPAVPCGERLLLALLSALGTAAAVPSNNLALARCPSLQLRQCCAPPIIRCCVPCSTPVYFIPLSFIAAAVVKMSSNCYVSSYSRDRNGKEGQSVCRDYAVCDGETGEIGERQENTFVRQWEDLVQLSDRATTEASRAGKEWS